MIRKKLFSIILAVSLLSFISIPTFAATTTATKTETNKANVSTITSEASKIKTLQASVTKLNNENKALYIKIQNDEKIINGYYSKYTSNKLSLSKKQFEKIASLASNAADYSNKIIITTTNMETDTTNLQTATKNKNNTEILKGLQTLEKDEKTLKTQLTGMHNTLTNIITTFKQGKSIS